MSSSGSDALHFRDPHLVLELLTFVYDTETPIPWLQLVHEFTDDAHSWKTVENMIYDLVAFGALHKVGQYQSRRRPDTRALKATALGRAWLDRAVLALPTDDPDAQ